MIDESDATRRPSGGERACTPYVLHIRHRTSGARHLHLFDLGEARILRMLHDESDYEAREHLRDVLFDYRRGEIMIAWREGRLLFLRATKG